MKILVNPVDLYLNPADLYLNPVKEYNKRQKTCFAPRFPDRCFLLNDVNNYCLADL